MTKTAEELRRRSAFDVWHYAQYGILPEWSTDPAHHAYPVDRVIRARWYGFDGALDQAAAELDRLRAALDAMTTEGSTGISYVTANGVPMAMPKRIQSIVKQALENPQ